jgi:hypothetical protein
MLSGNIVLSVLREFVGLRGAVLPLQSAMM